MWMQCVHGDHRIILWLEGKEKSNEEAKKRRSEEVKRGISKKRKKDGGFGGSFQACTL